jgi:hypothetical protein
MVEHDGRSQSIAAWARELGLDESTIRKRLRAGWSTTAALDPKDTRGSHTRQPGRRLPEWVKKKISASLLRRSLKLGLGVRFEFVPLFVADLEQPSGLISDSLVYHDPLELLCAIEEVSKRLEEEVHA